MFMESLNLLMKNKKVKEKVLVQS